MKVSILTLGCRVNQSESDIIEGNLRTFGCSIVELNDKPDYCIVNTCTVTAKSDYQSRQLIRRAVKAGANVIATGCYAQLRPEEIKNIEGNIEIIKNVNKYNIINKLVDNNASITFSFGSRSRPYLKMQDGCNFSCSYCTVPMARGRSKSLAVSELLRRARHIEASGYHEVVLTGIHLGSYGYDLVPMTSLSEIIKKLLKITTIERIRLSSLEVRDINHELIELLQEQRICKHLHLPLQSGDDNVLRSMNRRYSSIEYISTVQNILKMVPDIAIGSDIIVGFPGEGTKEFTNTMKLLDYLPISYIHIFPFSPRPHTIASKMANHNTAAVKRERLIELKELITRKRKGYMLSHKDKVLDIIVEEKNGYNIAIGTSRKYIKVKIPLGSYQKGDLVRVRATGIEGNFIVGNPIDHL